MGRWRKTTLQIYLSMSPLSQEGSEPVDPREEAVVNNVLQSVSVIREQSLSAQQY